MSAATRSIVKGYATPVAQKALAIWQETGPSSYATGGYTITLPNPTGLRGYDWVTGGLDTTGAYEVIAGPASVGTNGSPSIKVMWRVANTGAEVANGTDLSAKHARMCAFGG